MKVKTFELTGAALDWAVAKCEGYFDDVPGYKGSSITGSHFLSMWQAQGHGVHWTHSSTDWGEGGPIVQQENIGLKFGDTCWDASIALYDAQGSYDGHVHCLHESPLVAAMRCYIASKLGYEVEVPDELTD